MIYNSKKILGMVKILLELLKKAMNIFDVPILLAAAFILLRLDYSDLSTSDIIYLVVFGLWMIMLGVRIFVVYKRTNTK